MKLLKRVSILAVLITVIAVFAGCGALKNPTKSFASFLLGAPRTRAVFFRPHHSTMISENQRDINVF